MHLSIPQPRVDALLLLASELFQVYRAVWYTVATRPRSYAGRPVQQQQQKKELQQTLFARRRAAAGSRQHVSFHLRLLLDVILCTRQRTRLVVLVQIICPRIVSFCPFIGGRWRGAAASLLSRRWTGGAALGLLSTQTGDALSSALADIEKRQSMPKKSKKPARSRTVAAHGGGGGGGDADDKPPDFIQHGDGLLPTAPFGSHESTFGSPESTPAGYEAWSCSYYNGSDPPKAAQMGYYRTAAYSPAAVQSAHRTAKLRLARTISRIAANDPQLTKVKLSPRELVYGPWEHHIVPYCDEVNQRFLCYHMNDAELQKLSEALRGNQYVRHVGKETKPPPFLRRVLYSKPSSYQDRLGTDIGKTPKN